MGVGGAESQPRDCSLTARGRGSTWPRGDMCCERPALAWWWAGFLRDAGPQSEVSSAAWTPRGWGPSLGLGPRLIVLSLTGMWV